NNHYQSPRLQAGGYRVARRTLPVALPFIQNAAGRRPPELRFRSPTSNGANLEQEVGLLGEMVQKF
ncbi:MAG: hypothetical protein ACRD2L_12735, partial [Terriglobia bacterium]